jgi:hypothetical protein
MASALRAEITSSGTDRDAPSKFDTVSRWPSMETALNSALRPRIVT